MTGLFNAVCGFCKSLKPRCATVQRRVAGQANKYETKTYTMCGDCRLEHRGCFRSVQKSKGDAQ